MLFAKKSSFTRNFTIFHEKKMGKLGDIPKVKKIEIP